MVNSMSLNIEIDVASFAVARLKCIIENWDTLADVDVSVEDGESVELVDSDKQSCTVDVTNGLCNVFDDVGLDFDDYTQFYTSWVDVSINDYGKPNRVYPVDGASEYYGHVNLYTNPKRKALAEWCLKCLEEYVAEYEY